MKTDSAKLWLLLFKTSVSKNIFCHYITWGFMGCFSFKWGAERLSTCLEDSPPWFKFFLRWLFLIFQFQSSSVLADAVKYCWDFPGGPVVKILLSMQEVWVWSLVRKLGDFPDGSAGKQSTCNTGDLDSIPGLGRSPKEGNSYPLQDSSLENSMDCIVHGVAESQTQLSDFHFHFQGARIPCASWLKKQNMKYKHYCNKFSKDFKNGPH